MGPPPHLAPLLLLALLLPQLAAAIRSPQCPGGCIIATQVSPRRECACVRDSCPSGAPKAQEEALARANCGFCDVGCGSGARAAGWGAGGGAARLGGGGSGRRLA